MCVTTYSYKCSLYVIGCRHKYRRTRKIGERWEPARSDRVCLSRKNTPFPHICYTAEFVRSRSCGTSFIAEIRTVSKINDFSRKLPIFRTPWFWRRRCGSSPWSRATAFGLKNRVKGSPGWGAMCLLVVVYLRCIAKHLPNGHLADLLFDNTGQCQYPTFYHRLLGFSLCTTICTNDSKFCRTNCPGICCYL